MGGHEKQVDDLLAQGANREVALVSYAMAGHIKAVNNLIMQGADPKNALQGYTLGGRVEQKNILFLLASTDDAELRKLLAKEIQKKNCPVSVQILLPNNYSPYSLKISDANLFLMCASSIFFSLIQH